MRKQKNQFKEGAFILYKAKDLNFIKKEIEKFIGFKILFRAKKGRRKTNLKKGIIENAYGSIFVVRVSDKTREAPEKMSFSYADVLTNTVEITVCH